MFKKIVASSLLVSLACTLIFNHLPSTKAEPSNLIPNPSVETVSADANLPEAWSQSRWGTNTASFSYNTVGAQAGSRSLSVTMTFRTDGDAKWCFNPISVAPNTMYTYTDYYKGNVITELDAAITDTTGNVSYLWLTNTPESSVWKQATATFTTPANTQSVSICHILYSVGTLDTDNFSLTNISVPSPSPVPTPTPPSPTPTSTPTPSPTPTVAPGGGLVNIVPNPSLESTTNNKPTGWDYNAWGNNTRQMSYLKSGHTGIRSVKITMSNYQDGNAQWYFAPQAVTGGKTYQLMEYYQANVPTEIDLAVTMQDDSVQYMYLAAPVASTQWNKVSMQFTMPQGAKYATIYHTLYQNGYLVTDDYHLSLFTPKPFSRPLVSVTFDDGWRNTYTDGLPLLKKYGLVSTQYLLTANSNDPNYMTVDMMRAFKDQGSEIASHTVDHANLTTLTTSQVDAELSQSKQQLQSWFGVSVSDLATPYGAYNPAVITEIKKFYTSHRSVDVGYNAKDNFDFYNIHVQNITAQTSPSQVAAWVDQAVQQKTWLVLVYHEVSTNGDLYSTTPSDLDQELAYIKGSGAGVVTMRQALNEVRQQL